MFPLCFWPRSSYNIILIGSTYVPLSFNGKFHMVQNFMVFVDTLDAIKIRIIKLDSLGRKIVTSYICSCDVGKHVANLTSIQVCTWT